MFYFVCLFGVNRCFFFFPLLGVLKVRRCLFADARFVSSCLLDGSLFNARRGVSKNLLLPERREGRHDVMIYLWKIKSFPPKCRDNSRGQSGLGSHIRGL